MELELAVRKLISEVVREELARVLDELRSLGLRSEQPPGDGDFIDINAAARLVGVHHCTIREWIRSGRLKSYRAGRVYRLQAADVKSCLDRPARRAAQGDSVKNFFEKRATWDKEKASVASAAAEKGERISHHEVTRRTRGALKKRFGQWPPSG